MRKIKKQSLLLFLHPFLATISKVTISGALLAERMVSLVSSRCNRDQNHSQYAPLKTACINEEIYFSSNTKSVRVHQIAHISAKTPKNITFLSFCPMLINQFPSKCVIDLGGVNPVAI
jgi:hypothetical protein